MQHLRQIFDGEWFTPVTSRYFQVLDQCHPNHNDGSYINFVNFPKDHGFRIDESYKLHENKTLTNKCCGEMNRSELLQAWFFFQLINCVVRDDKEPFLRPADLRVDKQLSTTKLGNAVEDWYQHLQKCYQEDPGAATIRLLQANQILELAKQVVIANLAENSAPPTNPWVEGSQSEADEVDNIRNIEPDDGQALCFMVLGETLSAVLVQALKACNITLQGWELDDDGGWGPPAYVSKKMSNSGWCPRSQATLRGQLGRNATLLYATFCAHQNNYHNVHPRKFARNECRERWCSFIEAEYVELNDRSNGGTNNRSSTSPIYEPSHSPLCRRREKCKLIGPDEEKVLRVLEEDGLRGTEPFPLLRFVEDKGGMKVHVQAWRKGTPFATISHVWSQGLGNRNDRKIQACQLRMIQKWVSEAFSGNKDDESPLFWLDTFAIPQKTKDERRARLKKKAIGLIHHIFSEAKYCIVVDSFLYTQAKEIHSCRTIGVELLACGWMMRLWTLQEAFVSKRLYLAMQDDKKCIQCVSSLWTESDGKDAMLVSMTGMVRRKVDHNLMEAARPRSSMNYKPEDQRLSSTNTESDSQQRSSLHRDHTSGALLITSAWRATRYRAIRNLMEETVALATLLNLRISQNPDDSSNVAATASQGALYSAQVEKPEERMRDFWRSVRADEMLGSSIPSGMIFLPGKRLSFPGFGWAPATWISGEDESYPYPLDNPRHSTVLKDKGLVVRYPGFLLYLTKERLAEIIKVDRTATFDFPVNRGLYEWYRVTTAMEKNYQSDDLDIIRNKGDEDWGLIAQGLESRLEENEHVRVGIILSRPRPVGATGEIGLFVELYDGDSSEPKDFSSAHDPPTLSCKILRRVEVSRLAVGSVEDMRFGDEGRRTHADDPNASRVNKSEQERRGAFAYDPIISRFEKFGKDGIAGVQLDDIQRWCVDGYAIKPDIPPQIHSAQTWHKEDPTVPKNSWVATLRKAVTFTT